ncbi:MAG: hypothetical protein ACTSVV_14015, partial [Promethearchaeota archaeon]
EDLISKGKNVIFPEDFDNLDTSQKTSKLQELGISTTTSYNINNMAELEQLLVEYSTATFIIVTSAGSISEFGQMVANLNTLEKLIIFIPIQHFGDQSYINEQVKRVIFRKGLVWFFRDENIADIINFASDFLNYNSSNIVSNENLIKKYQDQIKNFKEERFSKINKQDLPIKIADDKPKAIIHVIPTISFSPNQNFNLEPIKHETNPVWNFVPLSFSGGGDSKFLFDGFIRFQGPIEGKHYSYAYIFKNGIIESVEIFYDVYNEMVIPHIKFEGDLIEKIPRYLLALKEIGVEPPFFLSMILTNVKEYKIYLCSSFGCEPNPIDRDILEFPEILINDWEFDSEHLLKEWFDLIWNACGYPRCLNYDDKGNWNPERFRY